MIKHRTFQVVKATFGKLFGLLFRVKCEGRENIPQGGGYILCSNHRTNLDPILVAMFMPDMPSFMAKEELFEKPVFRGLITWLKAFPVQRGKGDTKAIDNAMNILKTGGILAMFPEGTRSKDGSLLRPKSGAALIASQTGSDVLPVAICYSGKMRLFKGVTVKYGPVIPNSEIKIQERTPSELKRSSGIIMGRISGLLNS